jgi:hypothetical protein
MGQIGCYECTDTHHHQGISKSRAQRMGERGEGVEKGFEI